MTNIELLPQQGLKLVRIGLLLNQLPNILATHGACDKLNV
jgi:hypothetical protein